MKRKRFKDLILCEEFLSDNNKNKVPNTYVKISSTFAVLKFNEELGEFPFFKDRIVFVIN